MSRQPIDLLLVALGAVAVLALALFGEGFSPLQAALGTAMALWFPGYAMSQALLPGRYLGTVERLAVSLGGSMAATALGSLLLQSLPLGLQPTSWAALLSGITLGACAIAVLRRAPERRETRLRPQGGFDLYPGLLLGTALLVTAAAFLVASAPAPAEGFEGYTVLWIRPAGESEPNAFRLGVTSMEFSAASYQLRVEVGGQTLRHWPQLALRPGESLETIVVIPQELLGQGPVEARLYRLDASDQVYRQVLWWPEP